MELTADIDVAKSLQSASQTPDFEGISALHLREIGSMKWRKYPGTLAAFVAEMDFGVAAPIVESITDVTARGLFGYMPNWLEEELQHSTADWCARSFNWHIEPRSVFPVADVMRAFEFAIEHFSDPNSKIVLMTPAYGPFFQMAALHKREVLEVAMALDGDSWAVDFDALETALNKDDLLVLCNPHNPIGKTYTAAELAEIAQIVDRRQARVFSDEVHAPITYAGHNHMPYASIDDVAAGHALTATSASKAFNLPGLKCAQIIASNEADQATLEALGMAVTHGASNVGAAANTAAYARGGPWLASVVEYLAGNRKELVTEVNKLLPQVKMVLPESTYFGWLDCSALHLDPTAQQFFLERAKVALSDGHTFGAAGHGHVRFNFATSRDIVRQAVMEMSQALSALA